MTLAACGGPPETQPAAGLSTARRAVTTGPDFVVTEIFVPGLVSGNFPEVFAFATVCNVGFEEGLPTVSAYMSTDPVVTQGSPSNPSPDTYFGSASGSYSLSPGLCETIHIGDSPWPTEGVFYLGVFVDPQNTIPEVNEDNNTRVSGRIAVGYKPDLIVTSVTGPTSAKPRDEFTTQVKVCNQGPLYTWAKLELYLSEDTVITPSSSSSDSPDEEVGYVNYIDLGSGKCQTLNIHTYTERTGTFYLGAVVAPVNGEPELSESNNSLADSRISIGEEPDFVVSAITGPASVELDSFALYSVTVCNQGTAGGSADFELYLSEDAIITPEGPDRPDVDHLLGSHSTYYLDPGECRTQEVGGYARSQGTYYVGAVVNGDRDIDELREDNNTRVGDRLSVGSGPDLVVSAVTGSTLDSEYPLTASVTVCNQGTAPNLTDADVRLYLSLDPLITPGAPDAPSPDYTVGYEYIPSIDPGECRTVSINSWAASLWFGAHYVGASVNESGSWPEELRSDNNTRVGNRIGIGDVPDFVVSAVTGPVSALPDQAFTTSVTVCNQGHWPGGTHVQVYLSDDTVITPYTQYDSSPDYYFGEGSTNYLNPGECQTLSIEWWNPPEGRFYLGAVAALGNYRDSAEVLLDNNSLAGNRIGIGSKPDFIVSAATGPTSAHEEEPFTTSVTVCNQGTATDSPSVDLYLSKDEIITPYSPYSSSPDFNVGRGYMSDLGPGQCQTLEVEGWAFVPPGTYYLAATIDSGGGGDDERELFLDNNTRIIEQFTLTH
ncbi:CARDB domain-containing protein [Hyalangium versicolor]|uniref:CARDB domain-containing protein n=1 Tax=Hyalangium versicolor TaxID=2861190 RepID=UPI001CCB0F94|nr:CARDB domain-containing protein [Hyalangium versicolor]